MARSSSGKSSTVSTSSEPSTSSSSGKRTSTKRLLDKVCENPSCSRTFTPGHYGKRQRVGTDKTHVAVISCPTCKGMGKKKGQKCWRCKGTKKVKQTCQEWYRGYALQVKKPTRGIPPDDFSRIEKAAKKEPLKYACLIAARESGMRKGELLGLTWSDILDAKGKVRKSFDIRGQWDDTRKFIPTKTKNSRTGYFLPKAVEIVSTLTPGAPSDRVFPFYESQIYNWFIALQDRLRIKNPQTDHAYRWHDIRHTLGTELVHGHGDKGLTIAAQILGHKSINTTRGYSQLSDDDVIERALFIRGEEKKID
jgi:integrase